uniref:Multiple inositol polyphosphate phosphatase 1 n=1 Tax=Saccoglossus kowalevskii TaxID=10224 RepID=A0ABM0MNX0_SACKO|nr:PREDICTED: multiple inositol polyphosphate phosphatase 1-like [Saccoglossus kowalevskii]
MDANNKLSLLASVMIILLTNSADPRSDGEFIGDLLVTKTTYEASFGGSEKMSAVLNATRTRLQMVGESCVALQINALIRHVHVRKLYDLCANSMAIFNDASWCDVFTLEDLRIMEYWLDLKHYWRKSYGYKINYHISCQLLQHIFSTLEDAMMDERTVLSNHDNSPVGVFRFGHAETFLPLLSILGLYKDEDNILRYDNYHSNRNRTFRTSKLSPFAGNIAFVLYSCTDSTGNSMYMIEVLLHEQPVTLPCCTSTLCSYDVIKQFYSTWLEDCDFTEICRMRNEKLPSKDEL